MWLRDVMSIATSLDVKCVSFGSYLAFVSAAVALWGIDC